MDSTKHIYDNYFENDVPHALIKAGEADEHGWTTANMTMAGAHFAGWSPTKQNVLDSDEAAKKVVVDTVTINKPTIAYAVWVKDIQPRLSYDTNLLDGTTLAEGDRTGRLGGHVEPSPPRRIRRGRRTRPTARSAGGSTAGTRKPRAATSTTSPGR